MPKTVTEKEIQSIISKFKAKITEYEIIDMEKYKGWSSEFLHLIVSSTDNYILKGKTSEQRTGYDNEVKVSNALLANGILARQPILTNKGTIFLEENGYFWCLMTYIPGAQSHVDEYTEGTVKSLAEHIDQYILASIYSSSLQNLEINPTFKESELNILDKFLKEKDFLEKTLGVNIAPVVDFYNLLKGGYEKYINVIKTQSIIHNDINPRNILMDHETRNVISLIDWDHVRYGNPLKDLSDAVAIFYDYTNTDKASKYRDVFYKSFTSKWFTDIARETLDYTFLLYYTVAKWKTILFYIDLLRKYDDEYGEHDRFINEIKQNYIKWLEVITSI